MQSYFLWIMKRICCIHYENEYGSDDDDYGSDIFEYDDIFPRSK